MRFGWPARYPTPEQRHRYGSRLAPGICKALDDTPALSSRADGRGDSTDHKRFTDRGLLEREFSYGRSGFSMQFMLDTSAQTLWPVCLW